MIERATEKYMQFEINQESTNKANQHTAGKHRKREKSQTKNVSLYL